MVTHLDKMIAYCRAQQAKGGPSAPAYFSVPRRTLATRVRLFKTRGPFGEVVRETENGQVVAKFPADVVLAFLERERALELSRLVSKAKTLK